MRGDRVRRIEGNRTNGCCHLCGRCGTTVKNSPEM